MKERCPRPLNDHGEVLHCVLQRSTRYHRKARRATWAPAASATPLGPRLLMSEFEIDKSVDFVAERWWTELVELNGLLRAWDCGSVRTEFVV